MVFDLTRPGIESESTVSEVDTQYTRPLIGLKRKTDKSKRKTATEVRETSAHFLKPELDNIIEHFGTLTQ